MNEDLAVAVRSDSRKQIADFAARASFEATGTGANGVAVLAAAFPPGTAVYIGAPWKRPPAVQIESASLIAAAGLEPVPHVAARSFASAADLDRHLGRLVDRAKVRRALVIGGDCPTPPGPFHAALEVIESGLLQARGFVEIGVAGYPEGHPRLPTLELERALGAKIEAAAETGLAIHIVTQFGFSARAIMSWITRLRDLGIDNPVRVGLAGPASLASLMGYARICGVTASAQGFAYHAGLARHAFALMMPDSLLRALAEAAPGLGDVTPHIFSFGGLATAARWAMAAAAGRIALDRPEGFSVEPP